MNKQFFWVNHRQTAKQEITNSYLWSPKCNKNNSPNFSYENMLKVQKGDVIFSYARQIKYIGIAQSGAYPSKRPTEFGKTGESWAEDGWKINVQFNPVPNPITPKDHIKTLSPSLAEKYAPIQKKTGYGNQGCYLAQINIELAQILLDLTLADLFFPELCKNKELDIQQDIAKIEQTRELNQTTKKQLIDARIGQGYFRQELIKREHHCRVTKVAIPLLLRASHIKPWRDSDNKEKLDPYNGLLLTPNMDVLFDKGLISFEDNGNMIISPHLSEETLEQLALFPLNVGPFDKNTCHYLLWHRQNVFKKYA